MFIYYLLKNQQSAIYNLRSGMAQPHVYPKNIQPIKIPLPPLEAQKEMVAEIERHQKVIDGARQVVENWKPQIKINPDWPMAALGDIAEYINGFAFKPKDWSNEGVPIIRIQNLTGSSNSINKTEKRDIPEKYIVGNGDLLISWSATIGFYIWNGGKAYLNQHIFKVLPKGNLLKDYFYYLGDGITEEIKKKVHGNTMTHITKGTFNSIKIPLPSLEAQKEIVAEIETEQKAVEECKNLLTEMSERSPIKSMRFGSKNTGGELCQQKANKTRFGIRPKQFGEGS